MHIDYSKTFADLKERGLIGDDDKYAVCLVVPESTSNGVIQTVTTSKIDYIMSVNSEELKLFDIDKNTGEYLGSYISFRKADLVYGKKRKERKIIYASRGLFGGMYVAIHFVAENFMHTYELPKKFHGFDQHDARAQLYAFVKDVYNSYYDEKKRQYKNK